MPVTNYAILTLAQITHARTLDNDEEYQVGGRLIDAPTPGVGLNINPDAAEYAAAAPVALAGSYVTSKRIVDDPDCVTYCPDLKTYLMTMPWVIADSEDLFLPPEE